MTAPTLESVSDVDPATHRRLGVALFNHVWTLLEQAGSIARRDRRDDPRRPRIALPLEPGRGRACRSTSDAASGSARASTPSSAAASRPCGTPGAASPHAEGDGAEDWDLAAAFESMARASAVAGDPGAAADWKAKAVAALAAIAGPGRSRGHRGGHRHAARLRYPPPTSGDVASTRRTGRARIVVPRWFGPVRVPGYERRAANWARSSSGGSGSSRRRRPGPRR